MVLEIFKIIKYCEKQIKSIFTFCGSCPQEIQKFKNVKGNIEIYVKYALKSFDPISNLETWYRLTQLHEEYLTMHKEKGQNIALYGKLRDLIKIKCAPIYYALLVANIILK